MIRRSLVAASAFVATATLAAAPLAARAGGGSFIGGFSTLTTVGSTVPANGDVNPYGIVVVPRTSGSLVAGNILISNFNAASNLQGTGTTLVEMTPSGTSSQFAQIDPAHLPGACPGGVGLTTALAILPDNFVVVGSLPTSDGMPDTIGAGCLLVLDNHGTVVETVSGKDINGPWDMTLGGTKDKAELFVSNVLNGTVAAGGATVNRGTVVRIDVDTHGTKAPKFQK